MNMRVNGRHAPEPAIIDLRGEVDHQAPFLPFVADTPPVPGNGHSDNGHSEIDNASPDERFHTREGSDDASSRAQPEPTAAMTLDDRMFDVDVSGGASIGGLLVRVLGVPAIPERPDIGRRELILAVLLACRGGTRLHDPQCPQLRAVASGACLPVARDGTQMG